MDNSVAHTRRRPSPVADVARAAIWGGLTLIDPNKQTGWRKHAYWLAIAGATVWEVGAAQDDEIDAATKAGVGVGLAGLTYGAKDLLAKSDAWSMRVVEKVDRRRPRVWLALAAAGTSLASSFLDRKFDGSPDTPEPDFDKPTELTPHVHGLLATMLDGIEGYGSEELRAQLDGVQMVDDHDAIHFVQGDDDSPETLIKDYVFPARVEFERDGRTHIVELVVEDGRLSSLNHYSEPDWDEGEPEPNWDLPSSDELRVAVGQ